MWIIKIIDLILASFFSKKFYVNACFKWKKYAIPYLLLLSFITILPSIYSQFKLVNQINLPYIESDTLHRNNRLNDILTQIITQLPIFTLQNQELSSTTPNIKIFMPGDNSKMIININLQEKYLKQKIYSPINIFKNAIIVNINNNEKIIYLSQIFSDNSSQIIDHKIISEYIVLVRNMMLWFIPTIGLIFALLISSLKISFEAMIYMLIVNIYLTRNNIKLGYQQLFRLMIAASTPPIILAAVTSSLPIQHNTEIFVNIIISFIGFYYLLKSVTIIMNQKN